MLRSSHRPPGLLSFLATLALAASAHAQWPESDMNALFVPDDHVPLSQFVSGTGGVQAVLTVRPDILAWAGTDVHIAVFNGADVGYMSPDSIDLVTGQVRFTPLSTPGGIDLVVVSHALDNDFPIVTHWDSSLNRPPMTMLARGGHSPDATDGIDTITTGLKADGEFGNIGINGGVGSTDDSHADQYGKYKYATNRYALFSDGSELTPQKDGEIADMDVPGHERYIAENWSLSAIDDIAAIWLSDFSRSISGLPLRHLNPTTAFGGGQLQPGLPVMQVVHAYIVTYGHSSGAPGNEDSLATFVIPPYWTPTPVENYPVLFMAHYDIHQWFKNTVMQDVFLESIGKLYVERGGQQAIGIISNGGGSSCCLTTHESIYPNIEKLFDEATALLAVDRHGVVVTGGSRSGTAGIGLASSPNHHAFSARFIVVGAPTLYPGDMFDHLINPTYANSLVGMVGGSGYKGSWEPGWPGPGGSTIQEIVAMNLFGTSDFAEIDANRANSSPSYVNALANRGTCVILQIGTHDISKPFTHALDYYQALLAAGVPVRFEVGYRFGHGEAVFSAPGVPVQPNELELLDRVNDTSPPPFEVGMIHYHPTSEADEDDFVGTEFFPTQMPMLVESPLMAGLLQEHTYTIAGEPGTDYELWVAPLDCQKWVEKQQFVITGPSWKLLSGSLPPSSYPDVGFATSEHQVTIPDLDSFVGPWTFGLKYRYPSAGWTWAYGETAVPVLEGWIPRQLEWNASPVWFWGDVYVADKNVPPPSLPPNTPRPYAGAQEHRDPQLPPLGLFESRSGGISDDL